MMVQRTLPRGYFRFKNLWSNIVSLMLKKLASLVQCSKIYQPTESILECSTQVPFPKPRVTFRHRSSHPSDLDWHRMRNHISWLQKQGEPLPNNFQNFKTFWWMISHLAKPARPELLILIFYHQILQQIDNLSTYYPYFGCILYNPCNNPGFNHGWVVSSFDVFSPRDRTLDFGFKWTCFSWDKPWALQRLSMNHPVYNCWLWCSPCP